MISQNDSQRVPEHLLKKVEEHLNAQSKGMTTTLQQMVGIRSVKEPGTQGAPFGPGIARLMKYTASCLEQLGIEDIDDVDGYALTASLGDGAQTVGVLVHLDVVDAGAGWSVPPFEGRIIDNRMYGRGTQDDKGPAVAAMYALGAIAKLKVPLCRRIMLYFGGDEESGWADVDYFKAHRRMPDIAFSPDSEYPVINAEKAVLQLKLTAGGRGPQSVQLESSGGLGFIARTDKTTAGTKNAPVQIISMNGGFRPNVVPEYAQCVLEGKSSGPAARKKAHELGFAAEYEKTGDTTYKVVFKGKNAHASTPEEGVNAISHMLCTLDALPLSDGAVTQCVRELVRRVATETNGKNLGVAYEDSSGAMTLNLAQIDTVGEDIQVVLDLRVPTSADINEVKRVISSSLSNWRAEVLHYLPPHYVPEDHFLIKALLSAYTAQTGNPGYCMSTGGATYARAVRDAVTFGAVMPEGAKLAHQADEYIELDELPLNARIIAHALLSLAGA